MEFVLRSYEKSKRILNCREISSDIRPPSKNLTKIITRSSASYWFDTILIENAKKYKYCTFCHIYTIIKKSAISKVSSRCLSFETFMLDSKIWTKDFAVWNLESDYNLEEGIFQFLFVLGLRDAGPAGFEKALRYIYINKQSWFKFWENQKFVLNLV